MPIGLQDAFLRKLLGEQVFTISEQFTVSAGGDVNLHLKNPSGSGETIVLVDVTVSGDTQYTAHLHDEFDSGPSDGTSIEIQANYLDADGTNDNGVAVANKNVSYTNGAATFVAVGGGKGANSLGGEGTLPSMAIAEGREVVVHLSNTSTSEGNYSISLTYFEKND